MLFQSQVFILLFLPAVLAAYYASAERPVLREMILILASLALLCLVGRALRAAPGRPDGRHLADRGSLSADLPSRAWIVFGIAANLAVLGFFKYLAFVAGAVVGPASACRCKAGTSILPLGISFYTFELISYLVDLRRGDGPHYPLRKFCLFIFLFPHLIAGPIIRHNEIIPQFSLSPWRPGLAAALCARHRLLRRRLRQEGVPRRPARRRRRSDLRRRWRARRSATPGSARSPSPSSCSSIFPPIRRWRSGSG